MNYEGKKLLVLGGGPNEVSLVKRAQELGCRVVVTDYNLDRTLSPAKEVADEVWDVSWADTESLKRMCLEARVDGATAGYSEFRIEALISLCESMGFPCYCSREQLEITRDKIKFKEACRAAGVPTVREYASPEEVDEFPVIVKPVDRAGSIGVGIASSADELYDVFKTAMEASVAKSVIIEQYLCGRWTKFDSYYAVVEGRSVLLSTDDVIFAKDNGFKRVVQSAWLLPSRMDKVYRETIDPAVKKLIANLGIKNGYLFISGFVNPEGEFAVFEAGFRLCGGHLYGFYGRKGLPSNLDLFIGLALDGKATWALPMRDNEPELKCAEVNFYAKRGTVASISGFEKIREMPCCSANVVSAYIGQKCMDDKAILSKIGMVGFSSESSEVLADCVRKAYELIETKEEDGSDMIYDRINPDIIESWWSDIG